MRCILGVWAVGWVSERYWSWDHILGFEIKGNGVGLRVISRRVVDHYPVYMIAFEAQCREGDNAALQDTYQGGWRTRQENGLLVLSFFKRVGGFVLGLVGVQVETCSLLLEVFRGQFKATCIFTPW